ncbi:hypothetical protein [Candidatus Poriferisodalis sp.]|uniref:hypothetical protein n=1 Tax=Candidatus Poriferisodalis sp. TaxID=3101277 RepID=UPI003B02CD48
MTNTTHTEMATTSRYVAVDDGSYCWLADRDTLLRELDDQGWERVGNLWREPAAETDAYTELCSAVPSLAGEGAERDLTAEEADGPGLVYSPADGGWLLLS